MGFQPPSKQGNVHVSQKHLHCFLQIVDRGIEERFLTWDHQLQGGHPTFLRGDRSAGSQLLENGI